MMVMSGPVDAIRKYAEMRDRELEKEKKDLADDITARRKAVAEKGTDRMAKKPTKEDVEDQGEDETDKSIHCFKVPWEKIDEALIYQTIPTGEPPMGLNIKEWKFKEEDIPALWLSRELRRLQVCRQVCDGNVLKVVRERVP